MDKWLQLHASFDEFEDWILSELISIRELLVEEHSNQMHSETQTLEALDTLITVFNEVDADIAGEST